MSTTSAAGFSYVKRNNSKFSNCINSLKLYFY